MPLALLPNVVWHSLVGQPARFASGAGDRWLEFGRPSLLAVKEARLPAGGAPRPPARVAHDFRRRSLADALAPHAGRDEAIVVLEGVAPYLDEEALGTHAGTVLAALPRARFIVDLSTSAYRRYFGQAAAAALPRIGAAFAPAERPPREVVESAGWRAVASPSIADRARAWRSDLIPRALDARRGHPARGLRDLELRAARMTRERRRTAIANDPPTSPPSRTSLP